MKGGQCRASQGQRGDSSRRLWQPCLDHESQEVAFARLSKYLGPRASQEQVRARTGKVED